MPILKPGMRLQSAVCTTQVMVVAASDPDLDVTCGGAPMIEVGAAPPPGATLAEDASGGTQIGKRYVDAAGKLELLCTKAGQGSLAAGGQPLALKAAKPLPSSD